MSKNTLSESILDEIKEKDVTPKPKWQFLLHEWLIWILGGASVLVGGLALSIISVQVRLIDWDLLQVLGRGGIFKLIPFLWLVLLVLFIILAQYQIKHTKKGYQYSVSAVLFLLVSLSLLLGSIFYHLRVGYVVHSHLSGASPIYRAIADQRSRLWSQPEEGRLGGVLLDQLSDEEFLLLDEEGMVWSVFYEDDLPIPPFSRGIPEEFKLRITGEMIAQDQFEAEEIQPWIPPRDAIKMHFQPPSATNSNPPRINE